VDGILVVAKPVGPTSHDIVGLIRRLSATKRVGHGGTLDPFASGVLPIFLGKATRLVEYHLGDRKRYRATVCFGASSTTDDLEGELTPSAGPAPSLDAVVAGLGGFRGTIKQRPPDYSAIKVAGRRAYAMARAGQAVELPLREVTIHSIELVSWDGTDPDRPVAVIEVECSAGTYVRSLARDLGAAVGSAAYLGALVRTASGPFGLDAAIDVETIRAAAANDPAAVERLLLPVDAGLDAFPRLTVDAATIGALARGQVAGLPDGAEPPGDGPILVVDGEGRLVAVATIKDGRLAPEKVLVDLADAAPTGRR
jgi:tRNA pseudouridine55 synthase